MSELIFEPNEHKYFFEGKELVSASTLVSHFSPIFDESGDITRNCAIKRGKTEEELRAEWDNECEIACIKGKNLHRQVEHWIKHKQILDEDYKDVVEQISKIDFKGELVSEQQIFNSDLGIAGTVDMTEIRPNNISYLYDLKTNKKLTLRGFFRKGQGFEKMLYPVNHLESSLINKYALQCSIYSLIMEEKGYWIDGAELIYINPKTRKIERWEVPYLKQDALNMIDVYYGRKIKEQPKTIQKSDDFGF